MADEQKLREATVLHAGIGELYASFERGDLLALTGAAGVRMDAASGGAFRLEFPGRGVVSGILERCEAPPREDEVKIAESPVHAGHAAAVVELSWNVAGFDRPDEASRVIFHWESDAEHSGTRFEVTHYAIAGDASMQAKRRAWREILTALVSQWPAPPATEELFLHNRALTLLPESTGGLCCLRVLDLSDNELSELPARLGSLPRLEFLYAANLPLGKLPKELGSLASLVYLNASFTRLSRVPPTLARLASLRELRLNHNQLRELPDELVALTGLRELHLRGNLLQAVPAWFGSLAGLEVLDLRGNPLVETPTGLTQLPRLRKLDLRWTGLGAATRGTPWLGSMEARGCSVYL